MWIDGSALSEFMNDRKRVQNHSLENYALRIVVRPRVALRNAAKLAATY